MFEKLAIEPFSTPESVGASPIPQARTRANANTDAGHSLNS
jgi:hypothetical protein